MTDCERDEDGLPVPREYDGPKLEDIWQMYADYLRAPDLDAAIRERGERAFFDSVTPDDFSAAPEGVEPVGIADLWFQSTWGDGVGTRNVRLEQIVDGVAEGDLLLVAPLPEGARLGAGDQNWAEVSELGFGFFADGRPLPLTPYHDYDQSLFFDALASLGAREALVCIVTEIKCYGEDGIDDDPGFHWRVYVPRVRVCRVRLG